MDVTRNRMERRLHWNEMKHTDQLLPSCDPVTEFPTTNHLSSTFSFESFAENPFCVCFVTLIQSTGSWKKRENNEREYRRKESETTSEEENRVEKKEEGEEEWMREKLVHLVKVLQFIVETRVKLRGTEWRRAIWRLKRRNGREGKGSKDREINQEQQEQKFGNLTQDWTDPSSLLQFSTLTFDVQS